MMPLLTKYILRRYLFSLATSLTLLTGIIFLAEITFHFPFESSKTLIEHLLATFFKRIDLIFPLTFLIGTISTVSTMNKNHEIISMQAQGVSKKQIIAPLLMTTIAAALITYFSHEYLLPTSNQMRVKEQKKRLSAKKEKPYEVRLLDDGSRIIYSVKEGSLKDLFWIKSLKEIWHCESILFEDQLPIGMYVDQLEKNDAGEFIKKESYHKYALPQSFLQAKPKLEKNDAMSISTLFRLTWSKEHSISSDRGYIFAILCYQLINPWFPLMVTTAILPFLLPYKRRMKMTNLYLLGTLSFFLFYTMVRGCIILAENYLVSPPLAIILLPFLLETIIMIRLWKTLDLFTVFQTKKA